MDSTNPKQVVHQLSDPVFRIWTEQYELIIEKGNQPLSLIHLSIHPNSVHHKIWASSPSVNNIVCKKADPIIGKRTEIVAVPVFDDDVAAFRVVSSMLPLDGVDKFDRECLVAVIVSTVRKILDGPLSRVTEKEVNKVWVMDVEIDVTTVYFVDDQSVKFNQGEAISMEEPEPSVKSNC